MIQLEISDYSGTYAGLNGNSFQSIRPIDLARAMIMTGNRTWMDVHSSGFWRIAELLCKAYAYSELEKGNLVLHDRYHLVNSSEKRTISYYFGQGLTKLYSEHFLNVPWLMHIDDLIPFMQIHLAGQATPKLHIGKSIRNAKIPDLIGITHPNRVHIFEAKGYASGYNADAMQHAINQVSQIISYNGTNPETRSACFFDLSKQPIHGRIIDPEKDESGTQFILNEELAIKLYYSFFRENARYFTIPRKVYDYDFMTIPIGRPNLYFGFDTRLLKMNAMEILENRLYPFDSSQFFSRMVGNKQQISLGLDGILLLNDGEEYFI